ncbi:hypothetical protein [Streptomyces sp. NPDC048650]|uniref:hypothetical protein n=1 Tax=Streptomyces sp. NPDC048650 TaxID=3365583 RepID=UPI003718E34D
MTQSGQGHDPQNSAAGPAREGIVLPANGEPWVPDHQAAPSAGQPWGQPWGPDQQAGQPPAQSPGYGRPPAQSPGYGQPPTPSQSYGQPPAPGYPQAQAQAQGAQGYAPQDPARPADRPPMPQQALPPQGQGFPPPQGQPPVPPLPPQQPAPQPPAAGPPSDGRPYGAGQPPAYGLPQQPQPDPYGLPPQAQPQPDPYAQQPQPPHPEPYRQQPPQPQPERTGELVRATPQAGAPLPPTTGDAEATALIPPIADGAGAPGAAPLPRESAGQAESPGESTTMLRVIKPGQGRPQAGGAQPMPPSQPMPGAAPSGDSEATQLISPVGAGVPAPPPGAPYGVRPGAPGDRATPAEFEGLFRDGPGAPAAPGAPDATAQLPRFEDPGPPPYAQQHQGYGGQGYGGQGFGGQDHQQPYDDDQGPRRRGLPAAAIIGIVVVVLAGAGLGLGWMLSGGGDDTPAKKKTPAAGAGAGQATKEQEQPKPSADPAEAQAKGLDALLGDSGDSRTSVVSAVQHIKSCDKLGAAAKDLRAAAGQRNDLVTRLKRLPVDEIPDHAQLTAALTKAWQSSAAADNHFAAWAGQVGGKKGCHKGRARGTKQTVQAGAASTQATKAKQQAAQLWNPIAKKYGLTERRPEAL